MLFILSEDVSKVDITDNEKKVTIVVNLYYEDVLKNIKVDIFNVQGYLLGSRELEKYLI